MPTVAVEPNAIRVATSADVPDLAELKREAASAAYAHFSPHDLAAWHERFTTTDYFAERIVRADPRTTFLVVGPPGHPVGMVSLKERDGCASIGDLYTRGAKGAVAHDLVAVALDHAARRGFQHVFADVFATNDSALRFFSRLGFVEESGYQEQSLGVWVHRLGRELN